MQCCKGMLKKDFLYYIDEKFYISKSDIPYSELDKGANKIYEFKSDKSDYDLAYSSELTLQYIIEGIIEGIKQSQKQSSSQMPSQMPSQQQKDPSRLRKVFNYLTRRKGGTNNKYILTDEKVYVMHNNKKVKRSVYMIHNKKTKYCKINKEYVPLSKLKKAV